MTEKELEKFATENGWRIQSGAWERNEKRLEVLVKDGNVAAALLFVDADIRPVDPADLAGVLA